MLNGVKPETLSKFWTVAPVVKAMYSALVTLLVLIVVANASDPTNVRTTATKAAWFLFLIDVPLLAKDRLLSDFILNEYFEHESDQLAFYQCFARKSFHPSYNRKASRQGYIYA
jgi:hypothetical protein